MRIQIFCVLTIRLVVMCSKFWWIDFDSFKGKLDYFMIPGCSIEGTAGALQRKSILVTRRCNRVGTNKSINQSDQNLGN